ncbi:hypothetical protein BYT27DRAFT_7188599 [Phlegmacium glaucopus]|nr:hypothetical protein BYT27DRAFT_7188599 [Phlegmacium glaucopus]
MNKYHTFPNCMDVIINDSDGSEHLSTKALHRRAGLYSSISFPSWWPVDESHIYAFAEAASSPAKYSTFQLLGCKALQRFGCLDISTTLSTSARIGAIGGTVLTLIYFALLFARKDQIRTESTTILSFSTYAILLSKEMTYSAVAAIIGAVAKGLYSPHTLSTHAIAGVLGPILFLLLLFGGLGLVVSFVWMIEKFRDWYSGY